MYKVNRRAILCLLFFLCLMLSSTSLKAQQELKALLDKTVEAKNGKVNNGRKEQIFQSFNTLKSDTIVIAKRDTVILAEDKKIIEPLLVFDTIEFQRRNQAVKSRRPSVMAHSEEGWQRGLLLTHSNAYKKEHKLDSTKSIFGWHPYWMGTAYHNYNFSLLSAVAYTSYEVNPATGYYKSIHDWRTTKLIDSAHAHNCKVLLSVTNFGAENNVQFLSNLNAQHTFINTLITLLRERNADGVNIDFENIPRSAKQSFGRLLRIWSNSF